jgi:DNA-binding MarR family transcriptional regulator
VSAEHEIPFAAAEAETGEPVDSTAESRPPIAGTWPVSEGERHQSPTPPTAPQLVHLACRLFDARRAREKMLGDDIFGEPGWDILLACYCLPARGEPATVLGLAHAANVPASTGHRWQRLLMKRGLIERGGRCADGRRQLVHLSSKGRQLLERYLISLFSRDTPPPPFPEYAGGGGLRTADPGRTGAGSDGSKWSRG